MLATLVAAPFDKPGWVYEEKYDGERILAYKEGIAPGCYPETEKTARSASLDCSGYQSAQLRSLLLDGEVVIFDKKGVSRFQLLQQDQGKPVYAVFDCLYSRWQGSAA